MMEHPFKDKLVVFIGTPQHCSRMEARDALTAVGGIPDNRIAAFTDYAVAFPRSENTKVHELALEREQQGLLIILTERQFLDILAGRATPPEKPKRDKRKVIISCNDPEGERLRYAQIKEDILNRKRMNNLAKHGIPTPDGRVKVDLRPLDTLNRLMKKLDESEDL